MAYTLTYSFDSNTNTYSVTDYTGTPTDVVIPSTYDDGTRGLHSVTSIGLAAFRDCSSLTSVIIPDSVTSIGQWAFRDCSNLISVILLPQTPPTINVDVFYGTSANLKLYCRISNIDSYKTAWSEYADKFVVDDVRIILILNANAAKKAIYNSLLNYYTKAETYNKTEINTLIVSLQSVNLLIVQQLPTASATTYFNESKTIYLVANTSQSGNDYYNEYITIRSGTEGAYTYSWEKIGNTQVDLSNYYNKTEVDNLILGIVNNQTTIYKTNAPTNIMDAVKVGDIYIYANVVYFVYDKTTTEVKSISLCGVDNDDYKYAKCRYVKSGNSWTTETTKYNLQSKLTFDSAPTASSNNPVTSGGIKTAIDNAESGVLAVSGSVTIATSDWSNGEATKTFAGLGSNDIITFYPASVADKTNAAAADIFVSASGSVVTFEAMITPSASISFNYYITRGKA